MARASSRAAIAASRSRHESVLIVGRGAGGGQPVVGLLELGGEAAHRGLLAGQLGAQRRDLLGADARDRRRARRRVGRLRGLRPRSPRGRGAARDLVRAWPAPARGARAAGPRTRSAPRPLAGEAGHGQIDRQARRDGQLGRRELERLALPGEGGDPLVAVLGGPRLVVEDRQQTALLVVGRLHHQHRAGRSGGRAGRTSGR